MKRLLMTLGLLIGMGLVVEIAKADCSGEYIAQDFGCNGGNSYSGAPDTFGVYCNFLISNVCTDDDGNSTTYTYIQSWLTDYNYYTGEIVDNTQINH